jgi:REP element-mobilizing transposase RayT
MAHTRQQELRFRSWGGAREGAGRPRGTRVAHDARPNVTRHTPVHVTLRCRDHVWNLRSRRCFRVIEAASAATNGRGDFRVVHFSVQGNHLHLVVEAHAARALARGVQALSIRIAKGLNRVMGKRGAVFTERYHAHVLRTPAEARHALCYVLQNFRRHAHQRGERLAQGWLDPYSSATSFDGWRGRAPEPRAESTSRAEAWLLTTGWRRRGLLATHEVPGPLRRERRS